MAALTVVHLIIGCASEYSYRGKIYNRAGELHRAHEDVITNLLDKIEPLEKSLTDECLVYTLSFDAALINGVFAQITEEQRAKELARFIKRDVEVMARAIKKRKICKNVKVIESDGRQKAAKENIPAVYFYQPDQISSGWYYVSQKTAPTSVEVDHGSHDDFERFYFLIQTVEALVKSDNY
ncbi:MAG: hypothetical protein RH946_00545 [Rhodospirillales bacterium]